MQLIDVSPVLAVHRRVITGLIFCFQRGHDCCQIRWNVPGFVIVLVSFYGILYAILLEQWASWFFHISTRSISNFQENLIRVWEKKNRASCFIYYPLFIIHTLCISFCCCCQFINLDVHCVYGHAWNVTATVKRSACCLFCLLFLPPNLLYLFHCHDSRPSK